MSTRPVPNPDDILATWRWLDHAAHGISEVRVIRPGGGIIGIGFFDDEKAFVDECVRTNAVGNVYVGIQPRPRRLFDAAPNVIRPLRTGAGRKDIEVVTATVIDLDPVRPRDTASTDAELGAAIAAATGVADWCESEGLVRPRLMMSGNGAQLWFALPPMRLEGDARERIQEGLKQFEAQIRVQAQTDSVHVDSIHDVSRIIKVVGTVSLKGDGLGERPHRLSAPLGGLERVEDPALARRLEAFVAPPERPAAPPRRALPLLDAVAKPEGACAARTREGEYDWEHPVEMCSPVQRLWQQGAPDRSAAIFNMVRYFAHKGLPLTEITELILEYDRRGLGKLKGRDGQAYVRNAYEKVMAGAREDGSIAPPCHALQKLAYCHVNRSPTARCELYDFVFDIETSIDAIPTDTAPRDLERRLAPILDAVAQRAPALQGKYIELIEKRFGLKTRDLRRAVSRIAAAKPEQEEPSDAQDPPAEDPIDGEVYEDARFYYSMTGRGETKVISSFTLKPSMRVATADTEIIVAEAHTDGGGVVGPIRLPLTAFHSKRDLVRHLPSADMQWTGSDNNVQGLMRVLARRNIPRKRGTSVLGEYRDSKHHLWIGPDCAIDKNGFVADPPVVYLPDGVLLAESLSYSPCDDDTFDSIAASVFRFLPEVNTPEVILPVIGWFFATPLKPRIVEILGSFPALFLWGSQGSGKSTLCTEVMWPLFGVRKSVAYSATQTEFATVKLLCSTQSVPIVIDEYKPGDMPKHRVAAIHRFMRRLYRGEVEERGRPDQKVNSYRLQAPVAFAGETYPNEGAILERLITSNPEKNTLETLPGCLRAHSELRGLPLEHFAPRYIQFCLGRDVNADLGVAQTLVEAVLGDRKLGPRVALNLQIMALGLFLFEEFANECRCELPGDLDLAAAVNAVLKDVLDTAHGVKSALDHFVEMLGVMAVQGFLKHRMHYVFDSGRLAIHLESAYDAFRAHCKRIDYDAELVDLKAMRRLIFENRKAGSYVVAESERVYFDGPAARRRAVLIDLGKTQLVTADDFPQRDDRGEGSSFGGSYRARAAWPDPS